MGFAEGVPYDPARYWGGGVGARGPSWLVERRMQRGATVGEDPLDDLVGAAVPRVRSWMERKARLADGAPAACVLTSPETVRVCLQRRRLAQPRWTVEFDRRSLAGWETVEAGFLRWFCGLKSIEVARRVGLPRTTCQERVAGFIRAMDRSSEFRQMAAEVLAEVLALDFGPEPLAGKRGFRHRPEPNRGERREEPWCPMRTGSP
jgi:hypothetical protein